MESFGELDPAPRIAVLDYGMGNLRSVTNALRFVGANVHLIESPEELKEMEGLVFPGQGAIVDCMRRLRETGFDQVIRDWVAADRPFFGVCLGLQALFEHSEEGDTPGLGIYSGEVRRFQLPGRFKIPHMGWNTVSFRTSTILSEIPETDPAYYFVHSYFVSPENSDLIWGATDYGGPFCAAIAFGNCFATQFHPEKSQASGLQLYRNFLELTRKRIPAQ